MQRSMGDTNATGIDTATTDELDQRLAAGRPEFGNALDGLRARMLAATFGSEDVPLVAYDVRALARHGLIRLQRTQQVRGAVANWYVIDPAGCYAVAPLMALPD